MGFDPAVFLAILAVLAVAVVVLSAPLRRPSGEEDAGEAERPGLIAARDAKYREIREAELDLRTGKLSQEDWEAIDGRLRAEAVEILRRLDALSGNEETAAGPGRGADR